MRKHLWITLLLLVSAASLQAQGWSLGNCDPGRAATWANFAAELRAAKPGSPIYVPHPFPEGEAQVVENFLYQQREVWGDLREDKLPSEELRFAQLTRSGQARYEMLQVANWTPLACGPKRKREAYFLLRVFDRRTGIEVSRAAINDDGLLSSLMHLPVGEVAATNPRRFSSLAEARGQAASVHGLKAEQAQYVTSFGTLKCPVLAPCVAFRSGPDAYVLETRASAFGLYRLELDKPRFSFKSDLSRPERQAQVVQQLAGSGRELISLGGDQLASVAAVLPQAEP